MEKAERELEKGELDEEQQRAAGDGARISSSVEELINVRDKKTDEVRGAW